MLHKAKFILFQKLLSVLKAHPSCLLVSRCFFFYGARIIEDGIVSVLVFAFLMSLLGSIKSWLPSMGPMHLNLKWSVNPTAREPNPWPRGRRLCRKSLSQGNRSSAVPIRCHLFFFCLTVPVNTKGRMASWRYPGMRKEEMRKYFTGVKGEL